MAWDETLGGIRFTEANFEGQAYANELTGLPRLAQSLAEHIAGGLVGTSVTSIAITGSGTVSPVILTTFASGGTGTPGGFALGMRVRIAETADPSTNWMSGTITNIVEEADPTDGSTFTIVSDASAGSGTISAWTISIQSGITTAASSPATVAQGGTGSTTESGALSNLTGSVAETLGTVHSDIISRGVAIWALANDPAPAWYDAVDGSRSTLMVAVLEFATPNSLLSIYDIAADPPTNLLLQDSFTGEAFAISKRMFGGQFAVASDAGLRIYGWRKTTGFGLLYTVAVPGSASADFLDCCTGYGNDPVRDAATGSFLPMHAGLYDAGGGSTVDRVAIVQEDGRVYTAAAPAASDAGVTIQMGRCFYWKSATSIASSIPLNHIGANDWSETIIANRTADVVNSCPRTVDTDMDGDGQWLSWGTAFGSVIAFMPDPAALDQGIFSAQINSAFNTWFCFGEPAGMWFAGNETGNITDRTPQGNTLVEGGTVTNAQAAGTSDVRMYGPFSAANNYVDTSADFDFTGGGDTFFIKFVMANSSGAPATQILIDTRDAGAGDGVTISVVSTDLTVALDYATGGTITLTSGAAGIPEDDTLHHVVIISDATTAWLYVDGVQVDSDDVSAASGLGAAGADLTIGVHGDNTTSPSTHLIIGQLFIGHDAPPRGMVAWLYAMESPTYATNAVSFVHLDAQSAVSFDVNSRELLCVQSTKVQRFAGLTLETDDITTGVAGATNQGAAQVTVHKVRAHVQGNTLTSGVNVYAERGSFALPDATFGQHSGLTMTEVVRSAPRLDSQNVYQSQQVFNLKTLTDGATVAWDLRDGQVAELVMTVNAQLLNPTNGINGGVYGIVVEQDGASNTLTFDTAYLFAGGTPPSNTETDNAIDVFSFIYRNGSMIHIGQSLDLQ